MKILLLTQIVPNPPDSGPKIKTHYMLRWLSQEHDVTLVTFVRSASDVGAASELRSICREVHTVPLHRSRARDAQALARSFVERKPFVLLRDESPELRALLRQLTNQQAFDLVHADQLNMVPFAMDLGGLPAVLDLHNAVWTILDRMARAAHGPKRWFLLLERERVRRYEAWACRNAAAVLAVSETDRDALRAVAGDVPIDVVPIAVDVRGQPLIQRAPDANAALSVATMFWPPNVDGVCWFGREVFPQVNRQQPDAPFYVVGARPAKAVLNLASKQPGVIVTGYVPDLEPYQRKTAAFVVPLRSGSGMRVKILDAFARGLPIVSTTIGYEGIDAQPGHHLLAADDPQSFADSVLTLLRDRRVGQRLVEAGRHLAETRYDWRAVCPAIATTYARARA